MKVDIVAPAYNEAGNINHFIAEVAEFIASRSSGDHNEEWTLILVDDGSQDETWLQIEAAAEKHSWLRGVSLSRNYGHQNALIAGCAEAQGDWVMMMDSDGEHPISLIPEFVEKAHSGYPIVQGLRADDPSLGLIKRATSQAFYRLFSRISGVRLQEGESDFRLISREVLDDLLDNHERHLFIRGLIASQKRKVCHIPYEQGKRLAGQSKYSLFKMIKLAFDGITSFSALPLRVSFLVGLGLSFFALLQIIYTIYVRYYREDYVQGWSTEIILISLFFGCHFIMMGIVGEYIYRIFAEVKGRPRYRVGQKVNF